MKPLSDTLTELGIDCAFPIEIMEANDRVTYFEDCDDYWDDLVKVVRKYRNEWEWK
jgi:hypothetical protein